jgi:hypothetical protein
MYFMPRLNEEIIKDKVYQNSLETCIYISGYETAQSTIKVKCLIHNLEFETKYENVRRDNRKHHICPECQKEDIAKLHIESRTECECAYCHQKFIRAESKLEKSKSGLYFCCREHKDLAQRIESGDQFKTIRPDHFGTTLKDYRTTAFRHYEHKCELCDWDEDIDFLEVHHIDENRKNNNLENLIILCPICHKKLTTHKYKLENRKIIKV